MKKASSRDIEKSYSRASFVAKLRRLADAIEQQSSFRIAVGGEALFIPEKAIFTIEHERSSGEEELEFQMKWSRKTKSATSRLSKGKRKAAPRKSTAKKSAPKKRPSLKKK